MQSKQSLFDHVVGATEQWERDSEAERRHAMRGREGSSWRRRGM